MANRKPAQHPPMRTRKKAVRKTARNSLQIVRPDTDDPRNMLPAEAACGPLVDPILEDEDDSDDSPLDGGAP